jgi:hypothetical protein
MKASKPFVSANSYELYNMQHLDAIAAAPIQSKKPSVGPKGLIGPPLSMPWGYFNIITE